MSTIAVDNARPSAGGTAYSLTDGVAKAWGTFNAQGTAAVLGSINVTSLTDYGTGQIQLNFTNNFSDANYCASGMGKFDDTNIAGDVPSIGIRRASTAIQTSLIYLSCGYYGSSWADYDVIRGNCEINGDLA